MLQMWHNAITNDRAPYAYDKGNVLWVTFIFITIFLLLPSHIVYRVCNFIATQLRFQIYNGSVPYFIYIWPPVSTGASCGVLRRHCISQIAAAAADTCGRLIWPLLAKQPLLGSSCKKSRQQNCNKISKTLLSTSINNFGPTVTLEIKSSKHHAKVLKI